MRRNICHFFSSSSRCRILGFWHFKSLVKHKRRREGIDLVLKETMMEELVRLASDYRRTRKINNKYFIPSKFVLTEPKSNSSKLIEHSNHFKHNYLETN